MFYLCMCMCALAGFCCKNSCMHGGGSPTGAIIHHTQSKSGSGQSCPLYCHKNDYIAIRRLSSALHSGRSNMADGA